MRLATQAVFVAFLLAACRESEPSIELRGVAERLIVAAVQRDTATLMAIAVDTLVLRDLALIEGHDPELLQKAAQGLVVDHVGGAWTDSAYVYFRPSNAASTKGIDAGFVRQRGVWRVYYVGITGGDLNTADHRRR